MIAGQNRIIEQVTSDGMLAGELEGLAAQFEQTPDDSNGRIIWPAGLEAPQTTSSD